MHRRSERAINIHRLIAVEMESVLVIADDMNAKEATVHLALLGMYADNALTESEDALINKLMNRLGWDSDTGVRAAFVSNAFATVRSLSGNDEAIAEFVTTKIKPALPTPEEREVALAELAGVLNADGKVAASENGLLTLVGWILK